jgi:hypothetical protein
MLEVKVRVLLLIKPETVVFLARLICDSLKCDKALIAVA